MGLDSLAYPARKMKNCYCSFILYQSLDYKHSKLNNCYAIII